MFAVRNCEYGDHYILISLKNYLLWWDFYYQYDQIAFWLRTERFSWANLNSCLKQRGQGHGPPPCSMAEVHTILLA